MKGNKFTLSTAVGLCTLLLTNTSTVQAAPVAFTDTTSHWANHAIQRMSEYHVVNGYEGKFRPNDTITRGEMAVILQNIMQYQQRAENTFSDLGDAFYTDAISKANRAGVIYGANGKVRPTDPISRQEAVAMMARAFAVQTENTSIRVPDADSISDWAKDSVGTFMQKGYIDNANAFRPTASITRAEVVTILNRLLAGYYNTTGSFSDTVNGTVVVNTQDVILKDAVIDGDLILSEGVRDGDVTLENVTVKGRTLIRGGGSHSIHVTGNSVLGAVVMERDGAAVRLAVDKTAKVDAITVGQKAAEAIVTGSVPTVTVEGSSKLTAQDAEIGTISVTASDASVALTGESVIKNIDIADHANNATVSVDKNVSVDTIQIQADGAKVSGEGKVTDVKANADNIAVNTTGTKVSAAEGTSNVTAGGQNVQAGNSTTANTPAQKPSNGSGSSGGGSHRPSRPEKLAIAKVESVKNGLVRMTLNRASDERLTQDQFTIICTGAGKNMTILGVDTKDNRVYDLKTAYYNDNTYQLGLRLKDGTLLTYDFESKYDCPAITDQDMTRKTSTTAEFAYASDTTGTFYYTLEEKETDLLRAAKEEPTAETIMQSGKKEEMKLNGNIFDISGLKEHTAYTMYYVAKGYDDKVTPVKSIQIDAEPVEAPPSGNITITNISTHRIPTTEFLDTHVYLDVTLNQATATKLNGSQFTLNCPKGDIPLGDVETTDKQHYKVYLKPGHIIADTNFKLSIDFGDGTIAEERFSSDLTAPNVTVSKYTGISRFEDRKATVTFTTNEAGKIYWTVLEGSKFDVGSTTPKKPSQILNDKKHAVYEFNSVGSHYFDIDFSDKAVDAKNNLYFCFFSEDALGNQSFTFDYVKIPDTITPKPDKPGGGNGETPDTGKYQILDITGSVTDQTQPTGYGHVLQVTMNQNDTGFHLFSNTTVKITGNNEIIGGYKQVNVIAHSTNKKIHEVSITNKTLKEGDYTFEAIITENDQKISKNFHVDASGNVTSK